MPTFYQESILNTKCLENYSLGPIRKSGLKIFPTVKLEDLGPFEKRQKILLKRDLIFPQL
jgi:hypothetical protein